MTRPTPAEAPPPSAPADPSGSLLDALLSTAGLAIRDDAVSAPAKAAPAKGRPRRGTPSPSR
jgi:hypothetical protein